MGLKYGIIGTGAIGGYYGGRLAHAGKDVHFLLHTDYEYVKENGIQVDSCAGSFKIDNVNAYSSSTDMPVCDVVIVGMKTTNNHILPSLLHPVVNDKTLVVLIQNGIGVEEDLQQKMPGLQIAAGLAFICSAKVGPGHIDHQCYGSINIGNYSCRDEVMIDKLLDDFTTAGINAHSVEYQEARWKKAVWNMPFNGMTVALHTQTDHLLNHPATETLVHSLMLEVIGAAKHLGVKNIEDSFADKMIETTREMVPYSPSMRLDYDYKRPMEIYYIYTRPIETAKKAGYAMPKLEMLEKELKFLQSSYLK